MNFKDALKRSLGFEENLNDRKKNDFAHGFRNDYYREDISISPEQSFYEILLFRPKSLDDINYVVDQIIEENNPVILDLSFLEKDSKYNFKLAGEKIRQIRESFGAEALLLSRCNNRNLIIISPKRIKLVKKS